MNFKNKMITKKSKGFTIIELLVVIAIIAVLAAIVLVNVTQYITKGKDAAARGNLSTILVNAAIWYDKPAADYNGFKADTTYLNPVAALTTAGYTITSNCSNSATCAVAGATSFCASVPLKVDLTKSYCIDTTGKKVEAVTASATCLATGLCP